MNMWDARRLIIDAYDDTATNVFLVDTGTTLDPDYGFVFQEQLPFAFYEGTERILYATNGVHPSGAGYKQIGTCMAGFIQSKR
jgi:lysophospholipase L1-like esterase